ncbi:hypothetical protein TSUD_377380 [Trifolium subterraneum]|uniref:Uncharacterized protein n=1 Tax=Trifolium subterraneum TaxID=3900 RepID=A0A2Z6PHM6_TRISU|nr:hypothetical protein TSUD_377380 [Trifolium subterraneum]
MITSRTCFGGYGQIRLDLRFDGLLLVKRFSRIAAAVFGVRVRLPVATSVAISSAAASWVLDGRFGFSPGFAVFMEHFLVAVLPLCCCCFRFGLWVAPPHVFDVLGYGLLLPMCLMF